MKSQFYTIGGKTETYGSKNSQKFPCSTCQ